MAYQPSEGGVGQVRMTPADLGRRVMVRRHDGEADGRPQFRDLLGVLTHWQRPEHADGGVLTVVGKGGEPVEVPLREVAAAKPVPPAPVRRGAPAPEFPGPEAMQRIAAAGWPPVEAEALGGWQLRAAAGFTRRANSVQTLGDPGLPLDAALDAAARWYAARGLPAHVEVTVPGSPDELSAVLARRGAVAAETLVRTAPLAALAPAGGAAVPDVRLSREVTADWLSRYRRSGGSAAVQAAALAVLHGGRSVWFATLRLPEVPDGPAAIGRMAVDGAWAGFSAIEVHPDARRRGLARGLMAVLASRAAEEGATGAYLQVEADNAPARALYDRLGFTTAYRYHYARL